LLDLALQLIRGESELSQKQLEEIKDKRKSENDRRMQFLYEFFIQGKYAIELN
jgi:hypothetical protein